MVRIDGSGNATDGLKNDNDLWDSINWKKIYQVVNRLQIRIVKAVTAGNKEQVRSLQRLLARSLAGRLLAVKRVTSNRGKRTPGVDKVLLDTPGKKWRQAQRLNAAGYAAQPLKRTYVPKKNGKQRPLGIPVMHDRAEQSLEQMGLDPVSECTADSHSYGFRKKRSIHDAIGACYNAFRRKGSAEWVLEGDIKGCFDFIDHDWLLHNIPTRKYKLKQWLKSGYLERKVFNPTKEGTPQGGIISPTLANMALDGIESLLAEKFKKQDKVHFVRYADDFIITGNSKEFLAEQVQPLIEKFLKVRGLSLSAEKTKITHINTGFDFLGFNIRKYKGKLLTKPAKSSISKIKCKISDLIAMNKTIKTEILIRHLNPILRGWGNNYRHVVSKAVFGKLDHEIWSMTWRWAKRRHPKKNRKWIKSKYFQSVGSRNWVFKEKDGTEALYKLSDIPIRRHIKIKANANPYDPEWQEYFIKRSQRVSPGASTAPYQCLSPVR
jgi:RNA-directed DNA polymerase